MAVATAEKLETPTSRDFYFSDELWLSEDEKLVRDSARQFVAAELLPRIRAWDEGNLAPFAKGEELTRHLAKRIAGALNLFGATLPELGKYVGEAEFIPMTPSAYGAAMREIEYADTAIRSLASVQSSLGMYAIYAYGSEEQKKKWLPPLYRGEKLVCFGLTEPQGGSDPGNMKTRAEKTPGGWTLDGSKVWITNGFADVAVVWARTPEGIRGFLVEKGTPGFTVRHEVKWAMRAGTASALTFTNCRLPEGSLLPKTVAAPGQDLKSPLRCLSEARYGICWGAVGSARASVEEAIRFAKDRVLFDKPLAAKQAVQEKLVWCLNETENANLVALQLGRLKQLGKLHFGHISLAKYNNVDKAIQVAQRCVDVLPADVFTFEAYDAGRHLRNLQIVKKYEGAHEIHSLVVGRAITGVSAF
ncbi:MAG: acyl-CoA dehydrogenase family protein [Elusimicrobia bacterium]|nr:acyl-CoA dehydrogenase family protein [Elusimicrobiota bacterium]